MIVPAVGAQDTRITCDLLLPNQPSQTKKGLFVQSLRKPSTTRIGPFDNATGNQQAVD